MSSVVRVILSVVVFVTLATGSAWCAEPGWGNLKIRFVYGGPAPAAKSIQIDKDEAVCAKDKELKVDASLLVHPKTGGLANVIVFLIPEKGVKLPVEHPDHVAAAKKSITLEIQKCRFEPRVSLVRTKQELLVVNRDTIAHNEKIDSFENKPFAPIIPTSGIHRHIFEKPDSRLVTVSCSVHPWMMGWILIQDHPYMAVSNVDGNLEIRHVPVGKWKFVAWHERIGFLTKAKRNDKDVIWTKGRFEVTIDKAGAELGTISISPEIIKNY